MSRLRVVLNKKSNEMDKWIIDTTLEKNQLQDQISTLDSANKLLETDNRALLVTFE